MHKKNEIRQNTILGLSAILFMAILLILSWISERHPAGNEASD